MATSNDASLLRHSPRMRILSDLPAYHESAGETSLFMEPGEKFLANRNRFARTIRSSAILVEIFE